MLLRKRKKAFGNYLHHWRKKQALAILLSLSGQLHELVLELKHDKLNADDGVKNSLEKLDELYLKDESHFAYDAYERFETFSSTPSMTVSYYIIESEQLYNKAKYHRIELPDRVLTYWFLDSANIIYYHKQIVRAPFLN